MSEDIQSKASEEVLLVNTNNFTINDKIAKIQKDTQELINKTIDGQPANVKVVKVSEKKIIIEVNLNEFNNSYTETNTSGLDSTIANTSNPKLNLNSIKERNFLKDNYKCKKNNEKLSITDEVSNNPDDTLLKNSQILKRAISCSCDKPLRGILKYPNELKKRTLSESSYDNSISLNDNEDFCNLSNNLNSYSCNDLDLISGKPIKKVTFNNKIFKSTFSKNSSIMNKKQRKEFRQEFNKQNDCEKDGNTLKKTSRKKKSKKSLNLDLSAKNDDKDEKNTDLQKDLTKSKQGSAYNEDNNSISESDIDVLSLLIYSDLKSNSEHNIDTDLKLELKTNENDILNEINKDNLDNKENWSELKSKKGRKKKNFVEKNVSN